MSDTERKTMDVIVHKTINLQQGETLSQFTSGLRSAGRDHIMKKLNIAENQGGAFMVEVFKETVVFQTFKRSESFEKDKLFAFKFDRDIKTKKFAFGDSTEVERITSFQAKPPVGVSKRSVVEERARRHIIETSADGVPYVRVNKSVTGDTFWDSQG